MNSIENSVNRIMTEGIPFLIQFDLVSSAYLGFALFVAIFAALLLWSTIDKAF